MSPLASATTITLRAAHRDSDLVHLPRPESWSRLGNRTPDLLITRRPYPASYGVYQRQQLQISHLWVQ